MWKMARPHCRGRSRASARLLAQLQCPPLSSPPCPPTLPQVLFTVAIAALTVLTLGVRSSSQPACL